MKSKLKSSNIIRLDKFISSQTEYSRTEVKKLLSKNQIKVNGKVVKVADLKIDTEIDEVLLNDEKISFNKYIYLMLNKPKNYVCSTNDKISRTVIDLLPEKYKNKDLFPAGRLDKDLEGFVLMTNDGELAHSILSPKNHVPKYYVVELENPFEDNYIEKFKSGIIIGDGEICLPANVSRFHEKFAIIELMEGKYHQVKRMFKAVGNNVIRLIRIQIGGLTLNVNLEQKGCLELLHKDVSKLTLKYDYDAVCFELEKVFSSYLINNKI